MFIKVNSVTTHPPKRLSNHPLEDAHPDDVVLESTVHAELVNTAHVVRVFPVDFHDTHRYSDRPYTDKNGEQRIWMLPRSVTIENKEYHHLTFMETINNSTLVVLEDVDTLLNLINSKGRAVNSLLGDVPLEKPKKRRGRPPGSKNKAKTLNSEQQQEDKK
jgi:hypothetical protein